MPGAREYIRRALRPQLRRGHAAAPRIKDWLRASTEQDSARCRRRFPRQQATGNCASPSTERMSVWLRATFGCRFRACAAERWKPSRRTARWTQAAARGRRKMWKVLPEAGRAPAIPVFVRRMFSLRRLAGCCRASALRAEANCFAEGLLARKKMFRCGFRNNNHQLTAVIRRQKIASAQKFRAGGAEKITAHKVHHDCRVVIIGGGGTAGNNESRTVISSAE